MEMMEGNTVLERMRNLKNIPGAYFSMVHLKYNQNDGAQQGAKLVQKCRLRAALPEDVFETDADLYLPYTDLEEDLPKMCFKILVRRVAFPPDYEWKNVKWSQNE
jgi:hypothetical protein